MDKVLKEISKGKFETSLKLKEKRRFVLYPKDSVKSSEKRKQQWYSIRKVIHERHKVTLHKESQLAVKRMYIYY